jgi:acetyl/propionyl-CoA carboxylase alpha subunit/acetyl-CoA carboxylase carboxyltransferase component
MNIDFRRVAVVNRGEPAMRFIQAVREFNREYETGIRTIVFYTTPDRHARFVREADEALDLGDPTYLNAGTGQREASYLDFSRLERAMKSARADAVWVGWGFVAERPDFAELCARLDLVFIGPDSAVMRRLGDKISAKRLAEQLGIPVVPWTGFPADSVDVATEHARKLGYPVVVKATAGEGGRGIRRVDSESELASAFISARHEALRLFGNNTVFVEKWLTGARHVEVQVVADHFGSTWATGTRDCTIQRRHQKIVEEAPARTLRRSQELAIRDAAIRLSRAAGYRNAGTVEFLYDPRARSFALMEVNTRLQVEHPVTELTTGLDLVKLQIYVARGGTLEGAPPRTRGHAIEVRLNAEDPENGFAAAPGTVELFRMMPRSGLRLDSGVAEGDPIPGEYDSMFAKLVSHGSTRSAALAGLTRALEDCAIVVAGGASNRAFLLQLLGREEVQNDTVDVDWLDRQTAAGEHVSSLYADVALLQAAIDVYDSEFALERDQFFDSAARMRPLVRTEPGRSVELRYRGNSYRFQVYRRSIHHYRIDIDGTRLEVELDRAGKSERWLAYAGKRHRVISVAEGLNHIVEVDGAAHKISRDEAGLVRASAPSVVVSVDVKPGEYVPAGARLALLEAMKMEIPVAASFPGKVREIFVLSNSQVGTGCPLLRLDPVEQNEQSGAAARVSFVNSESTQPVSGNPTEQAVLILSEIRHLVLGSDIHTADSRRLLEEYNRICGTLPADHPELNRVEDEILEIFSDISSLFRRQATPEDPEDEERLSSSEYLLTYLRTLETKGAALPAAFIHKLHRTLRHYGSDSLEPTPALRGRLLWIYKSHQRMDQQVPAVTAILERRMTHREILVESSSPGFLMILERLVTVSENRFPALNDLARDVRYHFFEQPLYEKARQQTYSEISQHLDFLVQNPGAAEREQRVQALVECPYPLKNLLSGRFEGASPEILQLLLEVLTRRYYRIRKLEGLTVSEAGGCSFAMAEYDDGLRRTHVISMYLAGAELRVETEGLNSVLAVIPDNHDVVIDLYAWGVSPADGAEALEEKLRATLETTKFGRPVKRVVFSLNANGTTPVDGGTQYLTFHLTPEGYSEDRTCRGLHPMMSERLQLWRLQNFRIERLPSAEDVFLFQVVASDNPKDERLIAIAEVRDLTPVRDADGNIVQLPHLERMLAEALAGIRHVQLRRAPEERLHWNRVLLYVRPPAKLGTEELQRIARRLARQTEGLGLEKVAIRANLFDPEAGAYRDTVLSISNPSGRGIVVRYSVPSDQPMRPLTEYTQKVVRMRQRGLNYPYEVLRALTPDLDANQADLPPGDFTEYDLDTANRLQPVARPPGQNSANVVVGLIRSFTHKYPEGMSRVIVLGDPSKELGSIAEPECRRLIAAMDLAEKMKLPLEWFSLSAGAKISMKSGTENMDWIARVLRRLVDFTQAGGEVNVIVTGINVGAQPYWNAEATMLMHTRGILIMMPESAMVLTGKTALDYSGSVSAEDNLGIGGYEHVMGPNGQAQYWAQDLTEASRILMRHYDHAFIMPGERFPRRDTTVDSPDRDIRRFPHGGADGEGFVLVGDVFSDEKNPGRKKPFDIRKIMLAVSDQDHAPLERWEGMRDAEVAVVWDAHIGGYPVCLLGFESRSMPRIGFVAMDGPEQWTSGTLFPMASKKVARAINAANANRPLVILANLSGFDGSPESMRRRQLEFGAEIGRAIVNFRGPIVFCVISRYHGGAFVVFSRALNDNMEVVALEGTFASVIGGAPAAAVVFSREVDGRTSKDPRILALERELAAAPEVEKRPLRAQVADLRKIVRSEKLGEVAEEFDRVHSVHRALEVESLDRIIPAAMLRPYLIDAIGRGISRELQRLDNLKLCDDRAGPTGDRRAEEP